MVSASSALLRGTLKRTLSIEQGLIGMDSKRYWLDADDEKVCDKCGAIDGELVDIDEPFSNGIMDPPAHPGCRCGVGYKLTRPT